MKYDFEKITPTQWLNLVNSEENPSNKELKIKYVKIGDGHVAYAHTELGKMMSPSFTKKDMTDEDLEKAMDDATLNITKMYESRKGKQIAPNLLSFGSSSLS